MHANHSDPRSRAIGGAPTQQQRFASKMVWLLLLLVIFMWCPWRSILKWFVGLTVFFLVYLYMKQSSLLYVPSIPGLQRINRLNPPGYQSPNDIGIPYENCWIPTESKDVVIHGWLMLQPQELLADAPTIVYFHGNAGNIGTRMPNYKDLYNRCKVNIFAVEYRGYGESTGTPSEEGLVQDSRAALAFIKAHTKINQNKLLVFGRSLGGAVAIDLAAWAPSGTFAGVFIENTFTNVENILFPVLKCVSPILKFLLHNRWESSKKILKVPKSTSFLFLSGSLDKIVPPEQMLELFHSVGGTDNNMFTCGDGELVQDCKSTKPHMYIFPKSGHNDIMLTSNVPYYSAIVQWLNSIEYSTNIDDEIFTITKKQINGSNVLNKRVVNENKRKTNQ